MKEKIIIDNKEDDTKNESKNKKNNKMPTEKEKKDIVNLFIGKNTGIIEIGKNIGSGAYGLIFDVKTKTSYKTCAGKVIFKFSKESIDIKKILELRGENIII